MDRNSSVSTTVVACDFGSKTSKRKHSPEIVREGWLDIQGEFMKNWRQKYFELREDGSLVGFEAQPGPGQHPDPLNSFSIKGSQLMCLETPRPFSFVVRCLRQAKPIERMFSVGSDRDRTSWVRAIQVVGRHLSQDAEIAGEDDTSLRASFRKITLNDFELLQKLGQGSFGKVVLSRERSSKQLYAIKILKKQEVITRNEIRFTTNECRALRSTSHPFLISLKYSFQTEDRLCFVMEFVNGGELFLHLARENVFSEDKSRFYGAEIVLALEHLHERGIIHRDLKSENVLLDKDGHVRIVDFGLCKTDMKYGSSTHSFCGTPAYTAPEVVEGLAYGHAIDWWSLGVMMYEMTTGKLPFDNEDDVIRYDEICSMEVEFPPSLSLVAESLLRGLLTKDPRTRLGGGERDAEEVKEHSFFRGISWRRLLAKELEPPFKPQLESPTDTRWFGPECSKESFRLTQPEAEPLLLWNCTSGEVERQHFRQFSFCGSSPGNRDTQTQSCAIMSQKAKRVKL